MSTLRLASLGTALLVIGGCADGRGVVAPQPRAAGLALSSTGPVQAAGHFDAHVDFSTLTLEPRGRNCLLTVKGQLVFTGTIEGTGTGQTTALVFAPCSEVAVTPPGTYADRFRSEAVFDGTVDGQPATSKLVYMGYTAVGGHIDGKLIFSNGVAGEVSASAQVAVGGDYQGTVVVP